MLVDFYHLTRIPLDRALPRIAERVLESGGRLLIVAGDPAACARIDQLLWSHTPESFLPHAMAGGEDDALQPILIADILPATAANGARNIALVDGAWRDEALGFERVFHFFDEDRVVEARAAWRALADRDGIERRYWKQNESGKWEQAG